MSKDPRHKLQPGDAAKILSWWRLHPVAAENAVTKGACPEPLRPLGESKVLHHLGELSRYKAAKKAERKKKKGRR